MIVVRKRFNKRTVRAFFEKAEVSKIAGGRTRNLSGKTSGGKLYTDSPTELAEWHKVTVI